MVSILIRQRVQDCRLSRRQGVGQLNFSFSCGGAVSFFTATLTGVPYVVIYGFLERLFLV
jgi:hypothetical protein